MFRKIILIKDQIKKFNNLIIKIINKTNNFNKGNIQMKQIIKLMYLKI